MLEQRRIRLRIIIIVLCAVVVYLIGNASVGLWDRDEPRYAQTSREMLKNGDWVVPTLLGEVRTAKPIFIYWCQAGAMNIFGDTAFAARLPSVVGMTLTLILLATILWKSLGPEPAMWTVFILATAGLSIGAAKICLTDAVLLLPITIAQLCLCALYLRSLPPEKSLPVLPLPPGEGRGEGVLEYESRHQIENPLTPTLSRRERGWIAFIMWVAIGFAILTKGPVVLGVQLMTMLVLAIMDWKTVGIRWWSRTYAWIGILIAALICLPWAYLIHRREPDFFATILGHDVVNRIMTPLEGHKGPPGYYLATIWATFFPWSLLLPAAIVTGWKNRRIPQIRFALAAVIGPWIMFEIVQTKLPHYLLPVFPALAFLTADMLIRAARKKWFADPKFLRIVLVWGGIVTIVGAVPWLALLKFPRPPLPALAAMILLPILGFEYARSVYIHFRAARPLDAAGVLGIGMMLIVILFYGAYLPNAPFMRISQQAADVLNSEGATHPGDALMIDYKETSLAFYQGGTIRGHRDNSFLQNTPPQQWPKWIVLTGDVWKKTPDEIKDQLDILTTIPGWSYADEVRVVDVLVARKRPNVGN